MGEALTPDDFRPYVAKLRAAEILFDTLYEDEPWPERYAVAVGLVHEVRHALEMAL